MLGFSKHLHSKRGHYKLLNNKKTMKNTGWIKLHRVFLNWEWYEQPNMVWLFLKCLLLANHKDKKWRGIDIPRGSFITSIESLSSKKAKVSVQQVRTGLNRLKSTGEITIKTTNQYTHISINNYDKYQPFNDENNKQITNEQQTDNKQITTTNNDKNIKNIYIAEKVLTNELCSQLALKHSVSTNSVVAVKDRLIRYCKSNSKEYADYEAKLEEFLVKDIEDGKITKILKLTVVPEFPQPTEEQIKINRQIISDSIKNLKGGLAG